MKVLMVVAFIMCSGSEKTKTKNKTNDNNKIPATTRITTHVAVEVISEDLVEVPRSGQELVLGALDLSSEGPHVTQRLRRGQPLHRHLALRGTQKKSSGGCGCSQVHHLKTTGGSASVSN